MDCDRIPAPNLWDDETPIALKEYRLHIQYCAVCRERVLKEAPEKLLFQLNEDPLPEEFWLGFWDSVDRKRNHLAGAQGREDAGVTFLMRWMAVILFGTFLILYGRTLSENNPVPQLALLRPGIPVTQSAEVSVKLMMAVKSDQVAATKQIKYIGNTGDAARFYNYALLGDGMVTSIEGSNAGLYLGREYEVRFLTDRIQEKEGIIRLKNFELRKVRKGKGGKDMLPPLISATLDLRNSETAVLGANRVDEDQAILLILVGKVKK
jgi:hypothetical protein